MQFVKIVKKTNNKIDQARSILAIFTLLSDMKLSDSDLSVLAYFMVYGVSEETEALIVKSQILAPGSLANTRSKLKKFGLLRALPNKKHEINEKLRLKMDNEIGILIKIDNR